MSSLEKISSSNTKGSMKYSQRMNRHERRQVHAAKLASNMSGTGLYVYENNTDSDLKLPKAAKNGIRLVGPRKRFEGDSYFLRWVGAPLNLLRLIEEVLPKMTTQEIAEQIANSENKEKTMSEKLILDQPDTITNKGKVEHIVGDNTMKPLNDSSNPAKQNQDVLLNENPLDGVAIIKG